MDRHAASGRPQTAGASNQRRRKSLIASSSGHPRLQADNAIVGSSTPRFLHHSTTDRAVSSVGRRRSLSAGALEVQHGVETACHQTDNTACKAGPPRPGTVPAEFRPLKSTRQPPVGGATRWKEQRIRGASGRVIETRLGELRADKNKRFEFLKRVDNIIASRKSNKPRSTGAWSDIRQGAGRTSRKSVQQILEAYPLNTERKADLVELLRSGGIEANRATQSLRDPATNTLLSTRAKEGRRAREARIRDLVAWSERRRMEEEKAAREMNDIKERELWARRERLRQRRSRKGQTRMWLVVIKTLAASSWSKKRLEDLAETKTQEEAARIIARCFALIAEQRLKLRLEVATRVIHKQFAEKIRRLKAKRAAEATAVLALFLSDVKRSGVRPRVKLLAYRVARAHIQLAHIQRWWRTVRRKNEAHRRVMCRLWEQEVDRRVDDKVNEIFRARQDTQSSHSDAEGVQGWVIRNASSSSLGAHRAKAVRHAKEEKEKAERARLMLDPLINPPPDVKARMCAEYVKQKLKRHLGAVVTYEQEKLRQISASFIRGNKYIAGLLVRPRWRTGVTLREVRALVDAGVEFVAGTFWLWEPQTPIRLEDGTLVAESMLTPEELAAGVARRFKYDHDSATDLEIDENRDQEGRTTLPSAQRGVVPTTGMV
ncbi:unnamed protein product [Ascophyllum nodosum]